MTNVLNCIPAKHRFQPPCDKSAVWYVWYEGCGGVYTCHCNEHLAESLLDDTVQVVRIESIARVRQSVEDYRKLMVTRRICYKCQGRGVVGQMGTMLKATCGECGGSGKLP